MKTLWLLKRFLVHIIGKPCSVCGLPMVWVSVERQDDGGRLIKDAYWCVKCHRYRVTIQGRRRWMMALRLPLEEEA